MADQSYLFNYSPTFILYIVILFPLESFTTPFALALSLSVVGNPLCLLLSVLSPDRIESVYQTQKVHPEEKLISEQLNRPQVLRISSVPALHLSIHKKRRLDGLITRSIQRKANTQVILGRGLTC